MNFVEFTASAILFFLSALSCAGTGLALPEKYNGWMGFYFTKNATVWGAEGIPEGTSTYDAFKFGTCAIRSVPSYGGWAFEDAVKFHCFTADTNLVYGVVIPPSEGGPVNNPADNDTWHPSDQPGMIQSAKRFSDISFQCPQVGGITIDDFFGKIQPKDLDDVKAALQGKFVDPITGKVNHSSPATTPHLKLFVTMYAAQINKTWNPDFMPNIDGTSFWLGEQPTEYLNYSYYFSELQKVFPGKMLGTGTFLAKSNFGWAPSESVHALLNYTVDLFEKNLIPHHLLFDENDVDKDVISEDLWNEFNMPAILDNIFYPYLGKCEVTVVDADTGAAIQKALVSVERRGFPVTQKYSSSSGKCQFGSWAGKGPQPESHQIRVTHPDYKQEEDVVKISAQKTLEVTIKMGK